MNIEQFKKDGYTVLRDIFSPGWDEDFMRKKLLEWQRMSKEEFRLAARMFGRGASQMSLFLAPKVREAMMQLGVRDPVFMTDPAAHVMGVDQDWGGTGAHQDFPSLQSSLNGVVIWMPYTRVGLDNYPIEFAPGSHLRGLLPAKPGAHYSEVETEGMGFVPIPVSVGSAILFSVFTVHRTRTPGQGMRLAVSHRYEDSACPWFKEHRCYSTHRCSIDREVKWTPTVEQVREALA